MATKEDRQVQAKKHTGLVRGVFESEIKKAVDGATIYEDGAGRELELGEPRFETTKAAVAWDTVDNVILQAKGKTCVLDPASYTRPAGNYIDGGWSPECQICAESTLFPVLEGLQDTYYAQNRQSSHGGLNSDRAVYLTDIAFTTGGTMKMRDVLVIAPPNRRMALENHRSEAECELDLRHRIEALMRIAATHEIDTFVLCAFGCGAFDNNPHVVAGLFKDWLDAHPGQFESVVFAIPGGPSLDTFREVFPEESSEETIEEEEISDVEEDDDNVDVEPVSEGRWVFE